MAKINQTINKFIKQLHIKAKYKDALFRRCFDNKKYLLELYNALNGTSYDDTEELTVTTLDDCIYLTYKNDLSFIVSATLNLYEHQSTFNPNMLIRGVIYFARIYEAYIKEQKLSIYNKTLVKLPEPRYIIFYNGNDNEPDVRELRLSDAFDRKEGVSGKAPSLECVATMLNINYGHNMELMNKCKRLHDYAYFINEVNKNLDMGYPYKGAVDLAMEHCESNDILADIIGKHRSEVLNLLLNEFDMKTYERCIRNESKAEGKAEGKAEDTIELLEDIGELSDSLKELIMKQTDLEVLSKWLKLAARTQSIEDFEAAIGLVDSQK